MPAMQLIKKLLLSFLIFLTVIFSFECFNITVFSNSNKVENTKITGGIISYERVLIDGVYWIIIYEDGVRIGGYVDTDQNDY